MATLITIGVLDSEVPLSIFIYRRLPRKNPPLTVANALFSAHISKSSRLSATENEYVCIHIAALRSLTDGLSATHANAIQDFEAAPVPSAAIPSSEDKTSAAGPVSLSYGDKKDSLPDVSVGDAGAIDYITEEVEPTDEEFAVLKKYVY